MLGLHRKSGIPIPQLAELHGNTNLERCKKCKREYMRDFRTRKAGLHAHSHETGRKCDDPDCKGFLLDSIINFGEVLAIFCFLFHSPFRICLKRLWQMGLRMQKKLIYAFLLGVLSL